MQGALNLTRFRSESLIIKGCKTMEFESNFDPEREIAATRDFDELREVFAQGRCCTEQSRGV